MNSVIWRLPKDELSKLVKASETFSQVLIFFGLKPKGGNVKTLKNRLTKEMIDYSHIPQGRYASKDRVNFMPKSIPNNELFTENSKHPRCVVRRRILRDNLLVCGCQICGLIDWQNKPISLRLDHKNGIDNDHRLENLRWICPNCDSQQLTYGSKNKRIIANCISCGIKINKSTKSGKCTKCARSLSGKPSKDELANLVLKHPATTLAKYFKVSDKTIAKWCQSYGIDKPGIGYWSRFES